MGPPLKAAENSFSSRRRAAQVTSFNGAAAKSSGKYCAPRRAPQACRCFNGAAAKSSGKSKVFDVLSRVPPASMGPPLKAAENLASFLFSDGRLLASMGPPLKAAEN